MNKSKRLVTFITAASFLMSSVAPALAADTTTTTTTATTTTSATTTAIGKDVRGTKYETPVNKLAALGIVNGKDSEGNIKPQDTLTRAELAKILVTELNMDNGVSGATTAFKDVPASHWASGYIALAAGKGLIKGYPGGLFKPEGKVTYAEAATMMVRMLGYAPAVDEKAWPASYLSKAASIGVTKGVSVKANDPAIRGDAMTMAANSLDTDIMEQDSYGTETIYKVQSDPSKTILSENFDITVIDKDYAKGDATMDGVLPEVTRTPRVALSTLNSNEVEFDSLSGTYEVAPSIDPNKFLGEQVEAWVDENDDYVYYMEPSSDQEVIFDKMDSVDVANSKIHLDAKDDNYSFVTGAYAAKIWINISSAVDYGENANGDTWDYQGLKDNYTNAYVKTVLNKDDDIVSLVITDIYGNGKPGAGNTKSGLVKTVNADNETIEYFKEGGGTDTIDLDGEDYAVVKDGAQAKLSDLKADDMINVLNDSSKYYIMVTSTKVTGKVDKVITSDTSDIASYDVTIGGKKYDVVSKATLSEDGNKSVKDLTTTKCEDLDGMDVTAYLDANGDLRHVSTGTVDGTKSAKVALVTKGARYDVADETVSLTLVNEAGAETKFTFDPSDVDLNGAEHTGAQWQSALDIDSDGADTTNSGSFKPIIVEYDLDSAGNLNSVDVMYDGSKNADGDYVDGYGNVSDYLPGTAAEPDKDDDTLTVNGNTFNVPEDAVFFDAAGKTFTGDVANISGDFLASAKIDDVKKTGWTSVEGKNSLTNVIYKADEDQIDYVVAYGSGYSLGSDAQYAVVKGFTTVDGKSAIDLLTPDGKEIALKDSATVESYVYNQTVVKKGDFIRYETNADNEIDTLDILGYYANLSDIDHITTDLNDLNLDWAKMVSVTNSASTYIKGKVVNADGTLGTESTYIVNSNTKYFDISDTGALKTASGVSYGDRILMVDTDDDGATADYVVILSSN